MAHRRRRQQINECRFVKASTTISQTSMLHTRALAIGLSAYSRPVIVPRTVVLLDACASRCGTLLSVSQRTIKGFAVTPPVKRDQLDATTSGEDVREAQRLAALEHLRAVRPGVDHVLQELVRSEEHTSE